MQRAEIPSWLNHASRRHLAGLAEELVSHYGARLRALILFGSVARHEERPPSDKHPSDVDLFLLFEQTHVLTFAERQELFALLEVVVGRHRDDPRDINVMLGTRTLREWDDYFLEQVARDGIVLYASGPLPTPLRALEPSST